MRSSELTVGRRIALVLDPGEEVLSSVRLACAEHGIRQGFVPVFYGAFRDVDFIATHTPVADQEPPLPEQVTVSYSEGMGSGSVLWDEATGTAEPHLHLAVGVKNRAASGYAGHMLAAQVHYTVEIVIEEVVSPALLRRSDPKAYGIPTLSFGE